MEKVTIATRGSKLALWQANHVKDCLEKEHGVQVELNVIKTMGDKILDVPLAKIGGKGLFVKEIETALIENNADLAVHSMKDVPMDLPEGLILYASPEGEIPNDAFLSEKYDSISSLPEGAVVGTSSLRRKIQLLSIRPDLTIKDLRGNVGTRIEKMQNGEYDAIILAGAGLKRLGMEEVITEEISIEQMLPAVCQGILGIEIREDDKRMIDMLKFFKHEKTEYRVVCERAFLKKLEGGCQAPIAGHSVVEGDTITLKGLVANLNGEIVITAEKSGSVKDAENIGIAVAEEILMHGGAEILEEIYKEA